jgi:hypothetical protein
LVGKDANRISIIEPRWCSGSSALDARLVNDGSGRAFGESLAGINTIQSLDAIVKLVNSATSILMETKLSRVMNYTRGPSDF